MKGKMVIIGLLAVILSFTVYKMIQYESTLRQEKKIKLWIEDEGKPLINKLPYDKLKAAAEKADYYFMASGNYFKQLSRTTDQKVTGHRWEDFFLKGVNMGVAVPGKFPGEFSLSFKEYLEWFRLIGEMNANVIRTYTLLPPAFYDALSYYNLHYNSKPLYLLQGVWTELPQKENYYAADFIREFQKEIIRVTDAIHGNAVIEEHPGKASGIYATDVSGYVAGILLGREWEPSSVFKTNRENDITFYAGDFICMNNGNAMEAWLAMMMDFIVLYETQEYGFQHPVSFVNWLPLDPMYHNTEIIENKKVREFDNDLERIDFSRFQATELYGAGIYAAYHVYPYYPDFIYLQESYADISGEQDEHNSYYNYLTDLKNHTGTIPLVIAEYGLPSSRGNSHFSPFGYHQGGHSEEEQAALSLSLTQDIVKSRCAGAIYFEWIDEWFKHNWLVMDFEVPEDDRKIWHNAENPEQNFGILALEDKRKVIDGKLTDWEGFKVPADKAMMKADADATFLYLALGLPGFDLTRNKLYLAIDTYDKGKGDHKLPFTHTYFSNGFEFLVSIDTEKDAAILVDEPYSVFTDIYNNHIPVIASVNNNNGKFIPQRMMTNRARETLLGKKSDSIIYDRGRLKYGKSTDPASSNADWCFDPQGGAVELRLDWHLLNVSDPAKHYVLDDKPGTGQVEYTKTNGIHVYAFVTDKNDHLLYQYPVSKPFSYLWDAWETPTYRQRAKPLYHYLQEYFKVIQPVSEPEENQSAVTESFKIAGYYNDKPGAVSVSFADAAYSQYQYGLPLLMKYGFSATFGIVPALVDNTTFKGDQAQVQRMGSREITEIAKNNELAIQATSSEISQEEILLFTQKFSVPPFTLLYPQTGATAGIPRAIPFTRGYQAGKSSVFNCRGISGLVSTAGSSILGLDSMIKARERQWTILVYHDLSERQNHGPSRKPKGYDAWQYIQSTDFEKQLRLIRNSNYWVAGEAEVFSYLLEKKSSTIQKDHFKNFIFLKVVNKLDMIVYKHPLTILYTTGARRVKISGSATDGTFENRGTPILFNVMPNKEVTLELLY
jgi:hypothetical protein